MNRSINSLSEEQKLQLVQNVKFEQCEKSAKNISQILCRFSPQIFLRWVEAKNLETRNGNVPPSFTLLNA